MTLMIIACLTPMERVPTGSAMALAASVDPFTNMDPITNIMTMAKKGFDANASKNWGKLTMR
jgi:hypothetical protein